MKVALVLAVVLVGASAVPTPAPTTSTPTPAPTTQTPAQPSTQTLGWMTADTSWSMKSTEGLLSLNTIESKVTEGPPLTIPMCGNGIRQGQEQCDDGNLVDGDGCSKLCMVEPGFACDLKMVNDVSDKCRLCKDDECTIFHFGASHCLPTQASNRSATSSKKTQAVRLHIRQVSGFCQCAENHCMDIDGSKCRPEKDGWVANFKTNQCECGLGYCLMPMSTQGTNSPSKYHCTKLTDAMERNPATGICECAKPTPAVTSTDPALASPARTAGCKVYPSTPVSRVPNQGVLYPEFSCMRDPYVKSTTSDVCATCAADSCRMARPGVSGASDTLGKKQPNQFYCVANKTMQMLQMVRDPNDGSCKCSATECLVPYRDTMKCVPLKGSHPFGGIKLSDGKCGCVKDDDACIMPTKPGGFGTTATGFTCLRLREGNTKTRYGKQYYRGKSGYCRCLPSKCRGDPAPDSVGSFRCIDVTTEGAYKLDKAAIQKIKLGQTTATTEDIPCTCAQGACMLPGDTRNTQQCVPCPAKAGSCVGRCSRDSDKLISCIKYCSTEHVKTTPAIGMSMIDMFKAHKYDARVVRCFTARTVTCEVEPSGKKTCIQKTTARAVYDCPGVHSKRTNRMIEDGTQTKGFKSVCSTSNFQCQKALCNPVANPAVCLKGLLLT